MKKKVRIHPSFDFFWHSFFLKGLINLYGVDAFEFSAEGFPVTDDHSDIDNGNALRFILLEENKKVIIHHADEIRFDIPDLQWCDRYLIEDLTFTKKAHAPKEFAHKIKPICFYFPIRLPFSEIVKIYFGSLKNWKKSYLAHFKRYFYSGMRHAVPLDDYLTQVEVNPNYVYANFPIYRRFPASNIMRAHFIRACLSDPEIKFEGGFEWRSDRIIHRDIIDLATQNVQRGSKQDYILKTKQSLCAFICPANAGNLSWRLGEVLAMGKAIIATPQIGKGLVPLEHGVNIHHAEASDEGLRDAIQTLKKDSIYRKKIENGARDYFYQYGLPEKALLLMIQ